MQYGRWNVLETNGKAWLCRCNCGTERLVQRRYLFNGKSKSCGCFSRDMIRTWIGAKPARSPEVKRTWSCWRDMKRRCIDPRRKDYRNYGARGISVSEKWMDFSNFLKDMGEKPLGRTIERRNVNGNYCKQNCYWATTEEQYANKTNTVHCVFEGKKYTAASLCRHLKLSHVSLNNYRKHHPERLKALGIRVSQKSTSPKVV